VPRIAQLPAALAVMSNNHRRSVTSRTSRDDACQTIVTFSSTTAIVQCVVISNIGFSIMMCPRRTSFAANRDESIRSPADRAA
jgi:hypothetical protein